MRNCTIRFSTRLLLWASSLLSLGVAAAGSSFAWIYPEHRDIMDPY